MGKKAILMNETVLIDENFREMMLYKKYHILLLQTSIKLFICAFIIYATIISEVYTIEKMFFIFMSIVGIIDTLKTKEKRLEGRIVFKYEFYNSYFYADNGKVKYKIRYSDIDDIIDKEKYLYFIFAKEIPMLISKNGFYRGTAEELKQIINFSKKIHEQIQIHNFDKWIDEYDNIKKIDFEKYFKKEDIEILEKLKIKIPIDKFVTEKEIVDIEVAIMKYTYLDREEDLKIKEKKLKKSNVTITEFNHISNILHKIFDDYRNWKAGN